VAVSLGGSHERGFSGGGLEVGVGVVVFDEELDDLEAAVGGSAVEGSGFIVDGEGLVDQFG
jgi:hypothetical protein